MHKKYIFLILGHLITSPAWAYLDPGSVSLWLQGVIAAVAAVTVTSRYWWFNIKEKIKKFLTRKK